MFLWYVASICFYLMFIYLLSVCIFLQISNFWYVASVCFYFVFIYLLSVSFFYKLAIFIICGGFNNFYMPLLLSYFFLNMFLWHVTFVCFYLMFIYLLSVCIFYELAILIICDGFINFCMPLLFCYHFFECDLVVCNFCISV
jgi:hypothetical protein